MERRSREGEGGSSDRAQWFTRAEVAALDVVELAEVGMRYWT